MVFNLKMLAAGAGVLGFIGASSICGICDQPAARSAWAAVSTAADTGTVKLAIKGMTCGGCATAARMALQRAEGVYRAEVSFETASAVVHYDPKKTNPEALIAHLKKFTGYDARVLASDGGTGKSRTPGSSTEKRGS
ncbi:MAG: hypothetical protein KatS3mg081_2533 [Gemmatimonadales bacterium]|nr:MAG: hypothetical protein KatS3mg081_2533 [Gemmatimonadales bacterium]